jgi:general secretion pathway protein E
VALDFAVLGFEAPLAREVRTLLALPHGIVLVTGPTGSGKTTTLYTALLELNTPDKKLLSIEDPVEYRLAGINQVQVRPQIGLTFANALRSFLRHDPDIMMIGEIRDRETAEIAVQAALTGHLVLSTLHTNDAASALTRLKDMGVEDYLLTSTVNGILAQRLVRKLCLHCREGYEASADLIERVTPHPTDVPQMAHQVSRPVQRRERASEPLRLWRAPGCEACHGSGYSGRCAIVELLTMSGALRQSILKGSDATALREIALREGMVPMPEHGLAKAMAGITTLEEVLRVTRADLS